MDKYTDYNGTEYETLEEAFTSNQDILEATIKNGDDSIVTDEELVKIEEQLFYAKTAKENVTAEAKAELEKAIIEINKEKEAAAIKVNQAMIKADTDYLNKIDAAEKMVQELQEKRDFLYAKKYPYDYLERVEEDEDDFVDTDDQLSIDDNEIQDTDDLNDSEATDEEKVSILKRLFTK